MSPIQRSLVGIVVATSFFRVWAAGPPVPSVTIGQNFRGETYGVVSAALPPDCNGAIGPRHFVELINGVFTVYNKTNGNSVKRIADTKFWSNAGLVISSSDGITDPRMIYDPISQRWFASMVDFDANAPSGDPTFESNDFLLGVSLTSDPTGAWKAFLFEADPDNGHFADFPTLGVDANGVYLSGDFYFGENNPLGAGLWSFPKADLLAATPSIANATWFGVMPYDQRGDVLQPVTCFDGSSLGRIIAASDIGSDSNPHSNIVSFAVQNAGGPGATLSSSVFIPTPAWVVPDNVDLGVPQFAAAQSDGTHNLIADDARLLARCYSVNGVICAAQTTDFNGRLAVRWYRIRSADNTLLESGTISDPNLDFFYPSMAINPYGVVVIAFNGSGPTSLVSSYAMVGQTFNGVTMFGNRMLLQSGTTVYHGDDEILAELLGEPVVSRWGDYSATSVDPNDPNRFWTAQTIPTDSDVWSTQITELITKPQIVLSINRTGMNVSVSWPNIPGSQLQFKANVAGSVAWSNVVQNPITNANQQLVVTQPLTVGRQFYRVIAP
jgi:hypothetical protein